MRKRKTKKREGEGNERKDERMREEANEDRERI